MSFKTKHVSNFITHASNHDQRHDPCPIPTACRISSRNIHAKLHYIQERYNQKAFWSQETPGPRLYPQELKECPYQVRSELTNSISQDLGKRD